MRRIAPTILLVSFVLTVACDSERAVEAPSFTSLEITPTGASGEQGGWAVVTAALTSSGSLSGTVNLRVTEVPIGVAAVVSNVQSADRVTTATVTLNISSSTIPGFYRLLVHATGTGVTEITAEFALTVTPNASCPADGAVCEQWATSATASSEYTADVWSARQATGQPNSAGCEDDGFAWASLNAGSEEWLELTFRESVRPTQIQIYEVLGVSSIVKVEVKDPQGAYHTVYTAQAARQTCPRVLTFPVAGVSVAVNAVRLSFDQRTLDDWNEIDAVKMVGQR